MEKKKLNKVLIGVVFLIWGIVVYKLCLPYLNTTETIVTADVLAVPYLKSKQKKDTFQIKTLRRDPFLGKVIKKRKSQTSTKTKVKKRIPKISNTKPKEWPKIEYLGYVKSNTNTSKLGLLRINGILKRVKNGTEFKGISIKKIEKEQIVVEFQREVRNIHKNN